MNIILHVTEILTPDNFKNAGKEPRKKIAKDDALASAPLRISSHVYDKKHAKQQHEQDCGFVVIIEESRGGVKERVNRLKTEQVWPSCPFFTPFRI